MVYTLKTPYRDGTRACPALSGTQAAFDRGGHPPVDFIARLTALVPKPRVNLTRYHGVLAPNHRWRAQVTPARRGKGPKPIDNTEVRSPAERHAQAAMLSKKSKMAQIVVAKEDGIYTSKQLGYECGRPLRDRGVVTRQSLLQWLDKYHHRVATSIGPILQASDRDWLLWQLCTPLSI